MSLIPLLTPALLLNKVRGLTPNSSVSKDGKDRLPLKFETYTLVPVRDLFYCGLRLFFFLSH